MWGLKWLEELRTMNWAATGRDFVTKRLYYDPTLGVPAHMAEFQLDPGTGKTRPEGAKKLAALSLVLGCVPNSFSVPFIYYLL